MLLQPVLDAIAHAVLSEHGMETAIVAVIVGGAKVWDHRNGRRVDKRREDHFAGLKHDLWDVKGATGDLTTKVDTMSGQVRDLTAHVIGPDGKGGMRKDLERNSERINGLEERERQRPVVVIPPTIHEPYRP